MAVMWKPDPIEIGCRKMESHKMLHREAGKRGWSTTPRMSSIDRGRYYAEIDQIVLNPDGSYKHTIPNLKLGTGDTPLEAAANGYERAMPDDMVIRQWAVMARIEAIMPRLEKHAALMKKLDNALTDLTDLVNRGITLAPALAGRTETPVIFDEDDDL